MNSDTFAGITQSGTSKNQLTPLTGLGTTETIFTMGTDSGTPVNAFVSVPTQSGIVGSSTPFDPNANGAVLTGNMGRPGLGFRGSRPYFNSSSFQGRAFLVSLSGLFTTSAVDSTTGHAIKLYQNSTAALGGNAIISATSSATLAAGSYNFLIQATCVWDSVSQMLTGEAFGVVGGNYTARTVFSITGLTTPAALLFVASAKFNSGAANTVTPVEFSISQI